MRRLVHAVMCGGAGTRLWPLSRNDRPKAFLHLQDETSSFQRTVDRIEGIDAGVRTLVFATAKHRFLVAGQLAETKAGSARMVLEPEGRNTAPVAILAALEALHQSGPDALVLLSPADHHIADDVHFRAMIEGAMAVAGDGRIVTFGIQPDRASTGFGYIGPGAALARHQQFHAISQFREKPDLATAEKFVADGGWLWNSGIFLFAPETLLAIAEGCRPEMVALCRQAHGEARLEGDVLHLEAESFCAITGEPFDRAIMETIGDAGAVTRFAGGWSDLGTWDALRDGMKAGEPGGIDGAGPVARFGCEGVLALSDGPLVVAHGLKDMVVVASPDAVYVGAASASHGLSGIVADLARRGRAEARAHGISYHVWGTEKHVTGGDGFAISEVVMKPGGVFSSGAGDHACAHWVVTRGKLRVAVGEKSRLVQERQSIYVPGDLECRLENPGEAPIRIIVIRTGGV